MSGASNLGYGKFAPLSNVNGSYVNADSSNWPGTFSSNEVSGLPGLAGAKSNIDAVAGKVPGICSFKGGASLKRKIKNITKHYKKMKGGSRKMRMRTLKRRLRSRMASASASASRMASGGRRHRRHGSRSRRHRRRSMRGGYSQYQNNQPISTTYQVAGIHLPASQLALANPAPITARPDTGLDNYNHYTNQGFPSRGH